ncbi:anoctamin-10 isoform X2 [Brienomyrus brachyistius]|uniref:anoctamin-10 isoform X2 n=1 Tax=Brienomyrus brachyistius TaxID=42636 RepID=UPI0020B41EC0|nr:anoctamin-10 isoform X2 [Brienomyrus brachyistius]
MTSQGELHDLVGTLTGGTWTKPTCPCCTSLNVEPLVLMQLAENVDPVTKKWIISRLEAPVRDGGAQLLVHSGEDDIGNVVVLSAPRCTQLHVTEDLGICKPYKDGNMTPFSYHDRNNFSNVDDMQVFLTLAERQYVVKYQLNFVRAKKDRTIPGVPESRGVLFARESLFRKLEKLGIVKAVIALHDQQRLGALARAWYAKGQLLGQPLDFIQAYFGSSVAFYFSFLDFYTWALVPPALLGVTLMLLPILRRMAGGINTREGLDEGEPSISGLAVQAVFNMLWSTMVMELWKRRTASLTYRWGTMQLTERYAEPRPGYRGPPGCNPVTGRPEPCFPDWQRQLRVALVSVPMVGLFLVLVALGMASFYYCEALAQNFYKSYDSWLMTPVLYLPSVAHIVYGNMLGTLYNNVALALSEWENHRDESSYQNYHTTKVLVFNFFNSFAVLFHIAFVKQDLPLLRKRLASLLIISQLVNQCSEVVIPFLVDRFFSSSANKPKEDDPEEDQLRAQGRLPVFPGLFPEYLELLVQYGYLSLFSCVYPLTALLLLINNITEIRTDAFKICRLFRKPFSAPVSDIGVWQYAFEILGFVSVVSNCWLLLFSPGVKQVMQETGFSSHSALIFTIMLEVRGSGDGGRMVRRYYSVRRWRYERVSRYYSIRRKKSRRVSRYYSMRRWSIGEGQQVLQYKKVEHHEGEKILQ